MEERIYLAPKDIAKIYKISMAKQTRLRQNKEIPFYKVGKNVRYEKTEFENWFLTLKKNN